MAPIGGSGIIVVSECHSSPTMRSSPGARTTRTISGSPTPVLKFGWMKMLAEPAGEGLVAGIVELLAAEEDHQVLEQRAADLGDRRIVEAGADIDTADFRAQGAGDGRDGDAFIGGHGGDDAVGP